nr:DUF4910 domain-containing protein [Aeromonas veronii]
MYDLAARLYPINRSLTGNGVRESLALLCHCLPELQVHEVPTGTECFDWQVPEEWNVTRGLHSGAGWASGSRFSRSQSASGRVFRAC